MHEDTIRLAEKLGVILSLRTHDLPKLPQVLRHAADNQKALYICRHYGLNVDGVEEYEAAIAIDIALITDRSTIYAFALQVAKFDEDECPVALELLINAACIGQLRICFDIMCHNMTDLDMYKLFTDDELLLVIRVVQTIVYGGYEL